MVSKTETPAGEGEDYTSAFSQMFGKTFGAPGHVTERHTAERKANASPKQRARRAKRTVRVHFRTTPEINEMIEGLMKAHGRDRTATIDNAIKLAFAETEGE